MAFFKARYVKKGKAEHQRAKATIRYIQHHPGREGEKVKRELYGADGAMERSQAYQMIDAAEKGTVFFRIVISPDPEREDTYKDLLLQEIKLQDKHLNQRLTGLWNTGRHCYMLLLIALLLLQVPLPSLPLVLTPFPLPLLLVLLSPLGQPAGSTESTESTRSRSTLIMCPLTITKFIIRP